MQMSALCSAPSLASSRLSLRSPLQTIRPGTAPARTRLTLCRAQTQDFVPASETQLQGKTEPVLYKALKAACLLPAVVCLLWAEPAHAKKSRQPAAAAQIMEVQTAETISPAEQLQAKLQQLMLQLQNGSLQQQVIAELRKPDVQKGLAAVAGLLLVALIWKGSSSGSSSSSTTSSSSTSDTSSGSSSGSGSSSNAAAAPAPAAAAASSNGTSAATSTPRAAPAAPAKQPAAATAAASDAVSAQEILQVVKEAADKVSATAAATASEVSASAAAAAAAVERAQAVTNKAHSSLSRATSPDVPEPPKVVKPSLTAAAAAPAAKNAAAAAAGSNGNSNGASAAEPRRRSPPPSPIPILPEKGAATPALAVLGAGALLLDLMAPLGKLAVASVTGKVSRSSSPVTGSSSSSSSSSGNGGGSAAGGSNGASSSAPSRSSAPAAAAPAAAAPEVRKPATYSKLAKAVEKATAEAAAAVPRTVPTELPPVTLKELEEALKAGQKV